MVWIRKNGLDEKGWYGWEEIWMRRDVDAKGWYGRKGYGYERGSISSKERIWMRRDGMDGNRYG